MSPGHLRARSCPSCHSIGAPEGDCADLWHIAQRVECPACRAVHEITEQGALPVHGVPRCPGSGVTIKGSHE